MDGPFQWTPPIRNFSKRYQTNHQRFRARMKRNQETWYRNQLNQWGISSFDDLHFQYLRYQGQLLDALRGVAARIQELVAGGTKRRRDE